MKCPTQKWNKLPLLGANAVSVLFILEVTTFKDPTTAVARIMVRRQQIRELVLQEMELFVSEVCVPDVLAGNGQIATVVGCDWNELLAGDGVAEYRVSATQDCEG